MTTETILTDEQIQCIGLEMPSMPMKGSLILFARAIERAVLQSPEVQQRMDACAAARAHESRTWISTADHMPPEDDTLVLALHGGNEPEVVFGFLLHETLDTWVYTHWMPLPALPSTPA